MLFCTEWRRVSVRRAKQTPRWKTLRVKQAVHSPQPTQKSRDSSWPPDVSLSSGRKRGENVGVERWGESTGEARRADEKRGEDARGGNPFGWRVGLCLSYTMATLTSDGQTGALMAGRTDGQTEGLMHGWMDRQTDGQTWEWTHWHRWMDTRTDRQTDF